MANLIVSQGSAPAIRAAVYARFSTDKQSEESIADQVRVCTEHAVQAGWTVSETFSDEGISGAAVGNRPGLGALLTKCQAREFDVVLVMDLSRLSRSQADLPKTIDRLSHRGIRIVGVQDGYDSNRKGHKLQAGLSGIMGEAFREMVADRTYTALESRAKNARLTGGRAYGYAAINGDRAIEPENAEIVREIFTRYAAGDSQKVIASDLNSRGVPSPGSSWKRIERTADGKWRVSALHAILHNEIYVGYQIWNRREFKKDPDTGKRTAVERPRSEWIIHERPDLALVDAETWQKVRARDSTAFSSPHARPRYLLSGLLICDECGRPMTLVGGNGQRYVCSTNHAGGDAACSNRLGVARLVAEDLVLEPVEERFVSDAAVKAMVAELHRIYTGRDADRQPQTKADPRIAELRRLIKSGALSEAEARPALARLEAAQAEPAIPDVERLARTVEARAKAFKEALHGKAVSVAREALRRLVGSIRCVPHAVPGSKGGGYLMGHFEHESQSLPLHDWWSIGSGRDAVGTVVAGARFNLCHACVSPWKIELRESQPAPARTLRWMMARGRNRTTDTRILSRRNRESRERA